MKGSNSLTSHHGESITSRADKMSGLGKSIHRAWNGKFSFKFIQKFYNKKRRQFLKNENNWDKM